MSNLYAARDVIKQGNHYSKHVSAMTGEGLHNKSDIAAELAHRDIQIEQAEARIAELEAARAQGDAEPSFWAAEAQETEQLIEGRPRRLWWECRPGVGTPYYTRPQPAQQGSVPEGVDFEYIADVLVDYCDLQTNGFISGANRYPVSDVMEQVELLATPATPQEGE